MNLNAYSFRLYRSLIILIMTSIIILIFQPSHLQAEENIKYPMPSDILVRRSTQAAFVASPYVRNAAQMLEAPVKDLYALQRKGFGKSEIVTLVLMAKDSGKDLSELIKLRVKHKKLKEIAETFEVDYEPIRRKALKMKSELEKLPAPPSEEDKLWINRSHQKLSNPGDTH